MFIGITKRPIGEAPEWVRDARVGLRLPAVVPKRVKWLGFGVLSGPHSIPGQLCALARGRAQRISGYNVDARTAVERLECINPDAALWWRENTPQLLTGQRRFVFDHDSSSVEA